MTVEAQSDTGAAPRIALSLRNLTKRYAATHALDNVGFDVIEGSVHALMGGNGSGKSTLIKVLAGVISADRGGHIVVGDDEYATNDMDAVVSRSAGLRFVHQDVGVFPDLTVAENLDIPLSYRDIKKSERQAMVAAARKRLDAFSPESFAAGLLQTARRALVNPRQSRSGAVMAELLSAASS